MDDLNTDSIKHLSEKAEIALQKTDIANHVPSNSALCNYLVIQHIFFSFCPIQSCSQTNWRFLSPHVLWKEP